MRLYRNADIGLSQFHTCCSQKDIDDASGVAFQLDIPYEVLDFTIFNNIHAVFQIRCPVAKKRYRALIFGAI